MSSNLSYSDVDSQLGTQSQEPQDVGISVNTGISIFCHKRQSVIQHVILDSYYVPGTVVGGEKFETCFIVSRPLTIWETLGKTLPLYGWQFLPQFMGICAGGAGLGTAPKENNNVLLIYLCKELEKEVEVETMFCKEIKLCHIRWGWWGAGKNGY